MTRPVCSCHGEPMRRNGTTRQGVQSWACAVKARASQSRHWASGAGPANRALYLATEDGRVGQARHKAAAAADRRQLVALANRHGCFRCGSKGQLHRHHISPADKGFVIAEAMHGSTPMPDGSLRSVSFDLLYRELFEETIPLCPGCHVAEHGSAAA